jgi:hypothetical protein
MSDKAQMVLVGIHGDDLLDGYERLKKERDDALTRIAELEGARLHNCPVCEQPCDCRYPGAEGDDCECKNYHELEDRAVAAEEALADERETSREYAAELEHLRADHQELSDQFITNAQRLGSVCYSWHNWAVEIVGKEAARKMSGQDMRDEIARRLAGRTTDQAEPQDGPRIIGGHHEGRDVFQPAPDLGPSQKPCNCRPILAELHRPADREGGER